MTKRLNPRTATVSRYGAAFGRRLPGASDDGWRHPGSKVKHASAIERRRDRVLVSHHRVEVGLGRVPLLDRPHELLEPLHPVDFFGVANLRGIEATAQHVDRFVVGLERHREGVPILAAVREGEARRIGEARRRAVNDFRDQRQRLQRPRDRRSPAATTTRNRAAAARATPPAPRRAASNRRPWRARRDAIGIRIFITSDQRALRIVAGDRSTAHPAPAWRVDRPGSESRRPCSPTMAVCGSHVKSFTVAECQ